MRNEKYEVAESSALTIFEFISEGPRGLIQKRVQYELIRGKNLYNLAFGDVNPLTNQIDDKVISDNKDSLKVLSTVASTVFTFMEKYPNAIVFAEGSNAARTRLYRIGISNNLEEMQEQFEVCGYKKDVGWVDFEKNNDYSAFFIRKLK